MNLDKYKKTRRRGANRRWTLLFIGDHGNMITIKRFKAIIVAVVCLFLLVLGCLTVLFFSNQKITRKQEDLQKRFQNAQHQIETLRHEKEILMARLVVAESKAKHKAAEKRPPQENPITAKMDNKQPAAVAPSKPAPKPREKATDAQLPPPQSADHQTREAGPVMQVAVANFRVSRESSNANVQTQFKIKNTSTGSRRAAGRAVVVLKGADLNKNQWLVMPSVDLIGDKPSGRRGRSFSIQRFMTMTFVSKAPDYADQFRTAVVYVFNKSGDLLLEQDFAVKLPPLPVASSETSADQRQPGQAQTVETPSRIPSTRQKPPEKTPAAPATLDDDVLDSLEKAPPVF